MMKVQAVPQSNDGPASFTTYLKCLDNAALSKAHYRALLVAGSGFFVDSYDNFVIGLMVPMISWGYYGKANLPSAQADGWLKAASSWGNLFGQLAFGFLGDKWGRKQVFGMEIVILITGTILCAVAAWPIDGNPDSILFLLALWRFNLGVGVGGGYPLAAVMTAEFAPKMYRGQLIGIVFAMQGIGILVGSVVAMLLLAAFKNQILTDPQTYLGYCWRLLAAGGLIPAIGTLIWRHTLPESPRYTSEVLGDPQRGVLEANCFLQVGTPIREIHPPISFKQFRQVFLRYFSNIENLKVLIGCAATWFFLDVGYYGTTLNTPVVLSITGFGAPTSTGNEMIFDDVWNRACGTAVINLVGTVPGYWLTVVFIDSWGRKPIQFMGFVMLTLLFLFMAVFYDLLKTNATGMLVILYALAQFFFNFGPNATTFIIPAEVFPTALRCTCHGISAAAGKFGAIIAAQGFAEIAHSDVGFRGVLFVFSGCCFVGVLFTYWVPETRGLTLEELSGDTMPRRKPSNFVSQNRLVNHISRASSLLIPTFSLRGNKVESFT